MGRLIVVPTPIGNLEDMTFRGVRVLREVTLVLAEDTRRTRKLLNHYGIVARLMSYHAHNRNARLEPVVAHLEEGDVALVSDAGTPGLSDPGADLIAEVVRRGYQVEVLPGSSAVTVAAVLSGFSTDGFLFVGFLERAGSERARTIERFMDLPYPVVLYEAPTRLARTLQDLVSALGDREAVVARELTKMHEEVARGTLPELADAFASRMVRGEVTLIIAGAGSAPIDRTDEARGLMRQLHSEGRRRHDAVQEVMQTCGVSRNTAYGLWVEVGQIT